MPYRHVVDGSAPRLETSTDVTHGAYWPLFDLRLRTGRLLLRPTTEADLVPLADLLSADVEQDPSLPSYDLPDVPTARGVAVHQEYWRRLGTWRSDAWKLPFVVVDDGVLVGEQTLEADGFAERRTVGSASWLAAPARGQGIGKAMRLAVLALAFDGLGAEVAESSAWHDNVASRAVSRALGYVDNGVHRHADRGRVDDMVGMRLDRATWREWHAGHPVEIDGLAPCLPFFGVAHR